MHVGVVHWEYGRELRIVLLGEGKGEGQNGQKGVSGWVGVGREKQGELGRWKPRKGRGGGGGGGGGGGVVGLAQGTG